MAGLKVERLGRQSYGTMFERQQAQHCGVAAGTLPETLFLLEHERVITVGKNTGAKHVLHSKEELKERGVEYYASNRGGDATYHGPGQIVAYPILHLGDGERDIKAYVFRLEEIVVRTLAEWKIDARRIEGLRGIWVGHEKIAAIGVRIAKWTTLHGFALNVSVDLGDFELIVPCGLHGKGVTSMHRLLKVPPTLVEVEDALIRHAGAVFERETVEEKKPQSMPA